MNNKNIEKGQLIFKHPYSKFFGGIVDAIIGVIFGIGGIIVLIWTWFTFGNTDISTWNILWWDLFIILVVIMIPAGIIVTLSGITTQAIAIYDNGFVPSYRPLKYALRGEEVFIPWDDVVYIEYRESGQYIGDPSKMGRGYYIYYKLDGKIWCQQIGNYVGIRYLGKEYERKVFGKINEVWLRLQKEGKLLPEKPKRVEMTL